MKLQVARRVSYEAFMALSYVRPRAETNAAMGTARRLVDPRQGTRDFAAPAAISMPGTAAAKLVARSDVCVVRAYGAGVRPRDGGGARFRPCAMRTPHLAVCGTGVSWGMDG
jgi:hypothetical protein